MTTPTQTSRFYCHGNKWLEWYTDRKEFAREIAVLGIVVHKTGTVLYAGPIDRALLYEGRGESICIFTFHPEVDRSEFVNQIMSDKLAASLIFSKATGNLQEFKQIKCAGLN